MVGFDSFKRLLASTATDPDLRGFFKEFSGSAESLVKGGYCYSWNNSKRIKSYK
jgi:hypothetical protein